VTQWISQVKPFLSEIFVRQKTRGTPVAQPLARSGRLPYHSPSLDRRFRLRLETTNHATKIAVE
jgi:hypothetical protein